VGFPGPGEGPTGRDKRQMDASRKTAAGVRKRAFTRHQTGSGNLTGICDQTKNQSRGRVGDKTSAISKASFQPVPRYAGKWFWPVPEFLNTGRPLAAIRPLQLWMVISAPDCVDTPP
jgi:hypothetical protein